MIQVNQGLFNSFVSTSYYTTTKDEKRCCPLPLRLATFFSVATWFLLGAPSGSTAWERLPNPSRTTVRRSQPTKRQAQAELKFGVPRGVAFFSKKTAAKAAAIRLVYSSLGTDDRGHRGDQLRIHFIDAQTDAKHIVVSIHP